MPGLVRPCGHIDVITRCCRLFDEVHVVVAVNAMKKPLFTETERVDIIKHALADSGMTNYVVAWTDGLITDYCRKVDSPVIVKGLRQNGDYEAELGMALVNRPRLCGDDVPACQSRSGTHLELRGEGRRTSWR